MTFWVTFFLYLSGPTQYPFVEHCGTSYELVAQLTCGLQRHLCSGVWLNRDSNPDVLSTTTFEIVASTSFTIKPDGGDLEAAYMMQKSR